MSSLKSETGRTGKECANSQASKDEYIIKMLKRRACFCKSLGKLWVGCEEGTHLKENETQAKVHEGLKGNGKSEGKEVWGYSRGTKLWLRRKQQKNPFAALGVSIVSLFFEMSIMYFDHISPSKFPP